MKFFVFARTVVLLLVHIWQQLRSSSPWLTARRILEVLFSWLSHCSPRFCVPQCHLGWHPPKVPAGAKPFGVPGDFLCCSRTFCCRFSPCPRWLTTVLASADPICRFLFTLLQSCLAAKLPWLFAEVPARPAQTSRGSPCLGVPPSPLNRLHNIPRQA